MVEKNYTSGIRVLSLGRDLPSPVQNGASQYEVRYCGDHGRILSEIAQFRPDVLVSFGTIPSLLVGYSFEVRKRWINLSPESSNEVAWNEIEACYRGNLFGFHQGDAVNPLVSVYTGAYNTGDYIHQAFQSLLDQTYKNWEWVVVDDGSSDRTWENLVAFAARDVRVKPFRSAFRYGKIGAVKDLATRLCRGKYLVEFDHDDWLAETALDEVRKAFDADADVGFVYSNSCDIFEDGSFRKFTAPYWQARYRETEYRGKKYAECVCPDIYGYADGQGYWRLNSFYLTVGPNHLRAYRASVLRDLGGYTPTLPVADDWHLFAKAFLRSKCHHIDKLLYFYRIREFWSNTTFVRNKSIQDHLGHARSDLTAEFDAYEKRLSAKTAARPPMISQPPPPSDDRPCFVVASRTQESSKGILENLAGQDVHVSIGCRGILEAYEQGRVRWAGRRRVIYVHDDVRFLDLPGFLASVKALPPGTHGPCGTNDPEALEKAPWWDLKECHGVVRQRYPDGSEKTPPAGICDRAMPMRFLDGVCLIMVDQAWGWKVPGSPAIWHGYDWVACRRTLENGGKCFTLAQPNGPFMIHYGWGRTEGLLDTLAMLRTMARPAKERRDYPNIAEHLPFIEGLARGNVLELGCREGVSTSALLAGVEKNGGFVWSVDIDPAYSGVWAGHPQWRFILADAADDVKILVAGGPPSIDLLFIDTGSGEKSDPHTYGQTAKELDVWGPKVAPGGRILLHDTESFPGVKRAAMEYANAHGFSSSFLANCNGLGVLDRPDGLSCPHATGEKGEPGLPGKIATSDVSYVIPVAVPGPLLERCLKSIWEFSPGSEIILVENGCEIPAGIRSLANKVVRLEMNARFAAGCNRGAMEASRKILAIMNDDASFVDAETPRLLMESASRGRIAAPYCDRAKPPQGDVRREWTPKESQTRDMVVGVCLMLQTDIYRALGGFDTRLHNWEDDDLCYRARDLFGTESEIVGGAWVTHERHATFRALGDDLLKIMQDSQKIFQRKHPKIRVVAIAKNEEGCIRKFFEQFAPVTRDWFLLDTGSTDGTIEAARSIGVKVEQGPFKDFATARNDALGRLAGDAEWVIMMDPDERLDENSISNLKELVFRTEHDIFLAPLEAVNRDGSRRTFVPKPFLFRNRQEIRWVLPVHEKLVGSRRQALVRNAKIEHMIALHDEGKRQAAAQQYRALGENQNYYQTPEYRKVRAEWPILDYERADDDRIMKIFLGPLVSVVIPTYRRTALLERAINSALSQDYANLEVVVVGDDCPDLKGVSGLFAGPRVRIYNLPRNYGAGGAEPRNFGIMVAAGGLIAYLDDDNAWKSDHVSSVVGAMLEKAAAFGFSSMEVDGKDMGFSEPNLGGIDTSCVVHRKFLVTKHGWWKNRQTGGYAHDWEFFSRWVQANEVWVCTGRPTLVYNAETSGQKTFLKERVAMAPAPAVPPAPVTPPAPGGTLLTVAVPSIASRFTGSLQVLLASLFAQSEGKPVEVMCLLDNRKMTVAEKRNQAIRTAQGRFIVFVDDDDSVSPDYIDSILTAVRARPDAKCVVFDAMVHGYNKDGYNPTPDNPAIDRLCKYGVELEHRNAPEAYYRKPNHLMVFSIDVARRAPPYVNVDNEDTVWAEGARRLFDAASQTRIDKVLYHYNYDPRGTTQGRLQSLLKAR